MILEIALRPLRRAFFVCRIKVFICTPGFLMLFDYALYCGRGTEPFDPAYNIVVALSSS